MPSTLQKKKYNDENYMSHLYRLRKHSDLADRISGYKEDGHSLNQLISELLAGHFGVPLPMKYYITREIIYLAQKGDAMILEHETRPADENDCHECDRPFEEAGDQKYSLPGGRVICADCIENYAVAL